MAASDSVQLRNAVVDSSDKKSFDKVRILVVAGLKSKAVGEKICHINLEREDAINSIFSTPTEIPRESAACVVHNDLYIVGVGLDSNELWEWSAEKDEWTRLADLPSGRSRHCAACTEGKIYILGGWVVDDEKALDSVLCYNINSNVWTQVTQLCYAVHSAACVTFKHFIYVFGGIAINEAEVNHVQVYDTSTAEVTLGSNPMPAEEGLMRAVLWGSKALLIGVCTCYIYDLELNTWEERDGFETGVQHFGLTLSDDTLYISGGGTYSSDGNNETVWTCSHEVKSLSVNDFISDNQQAEWKHQNKLPFPALVSLYSDFKIERAASCYPTVDVAYVDAELQGQMRGMAVVDDQLFIVPSEDPVVNVYDVRSLKAQNVIYILNMKNPFDFAGCSREKVLYISDWQLQCVHRVQISNGISNKWLMKENRWPRRLSVTSGHTLLVILQFGSRADRVAEYTSEGEELREIEFETAGISWALKVVELNSKEFFVSHSFPRGLCLINRFGQMQRYHDEHDGQGWRNRLVYALTLALYWPLQY